jgi:hypothetical protein
MGYYNSFIVRVWADGQGRLHGNIEHVASKDNLAFIDLQAVVAFMRGRLAPPASELDQPVGSADDPTGPDGKLSGSQGEKAIGWNDADGDATH